MKHFLPALRLLIFMTLLTGVAYPLLITGIAQVAFADRANGELQQRGGVLIGSSLIAQKFEGVNYFWSRPSAVGYNPQPSGGSNLGQISEDLKKAYLERKELLKAAHKDQTIDPPQDLLFASASGLDPHISPEAAKYQLARVADNRHLDKVQVEKLVNDMTESRQFGIFGEPTVNVLALNLALDKLQGIETAPQVKPEVKK